MTKGEHRSYGKRLVAEETKRIVVGSKSLFRVIPADRDEQYEDVVDGRAILRSKRVLLSNHFKRWYFHVKGSQLIVGARSWQESLYIAILGTLTYPDDI